MKRSLLPSTQMNSHYATRPALRQKRNEHEFSLSRINPPAVPFKRQPSITTDAGAPQEPTQAKARKGSTQL